MDDTVLAFIEKHRNQSPAELALLLSKKPHLPKEFILNQVNGLQKAKQKLPFLVESEKFIYPSARAFSQASSEKTGTYKAGIFNAKKIPPNVNAKDGKYVFD